jgi:hypothetical protein
MRIVHNIPLFINVKGQEQITKGLSNFLDSNKILSALLWRSFSNKKRTAASCHSHGRHDAKRRLVLWAVRAWCWFQTDMPPIPFICVRFGSHLGPLYLNTPDCTRLNKIRLHYRSERQKKNKTPHTRDTRQFVFIWLVNSRSGSLAWVPR